MCVFFFNPPPSIIHFAKYMTIRDYDKGNLTRCVKTFYLLGMDLDNLTVLSKDFIG